jgi:hypothetical protein
MGRAVGEVVDVLEGAPVGDHDPFGDAVGIRASCCRLAENCDSFSISFSLNIWAEESHEHPESCVSAPFNSSVIFLKNPPTFPKPGSNTPSG